MAIIGRLLIDYSRLELDLMNAVQVVRNHDLNGVLKAMYRVRGETNRIDIADGLARHEYEQTNLGAEWDATIAALRYCLKIRNKYAHSYWHDPDQGKQLCYVSLEELAKLDDFIPDLVSLTFFYVDETTLLKQEAFFGYAEALTNHVNHEFRHRKKVIRRQPFVFPAVMQYPPLYKRKVENPASKPVHSSKKSRIQP